MHMRKYSLVVLQCLAAVLLLAGMAEAQGSSSQNAGKVTAIVPNATRNASPTRVQDDLQWQDLLKTDASGRLRGALSDGSIISVGRESQFRVVQHDAASQQTVLELNYGRMRNQVVKLTKPGAKYEVHTPSAVVGVIGTDFYLLVTANRTVVIVFSGIVKVTRLMAGTSEMTGPSVEVHQGQMVEVTPDGVGQVGPASQETQQEAMAETAIPEKGRGHKRENAFSRVDIGGFYSYTHFNPGGSGPRFGAHGGGGSIGVNLNDWLGFLADFRVQGLRGLSSGESARLFSYNFGPQFSLHRGTVTPFFHFLVGGARLTASGSSSLSDVENAWSFAPGGGITVRLSPHFSLMPVAIEDYITRFTGDYSGVHETQNNFRFTTGVIVHLGKR